MFDAGGEFEGQVEALAWLAEGLGLGPVSEVIDLGSGLVAPVAWLTGRHECRTVVLDPAPHTASSAREQFGLTAVAATADAVPFGADGFDVALLLGTLSSAADASSVLGEAKRVASRLGVLDLASTGRRAVRTAAGLFRTPGRLCEVLAAAGWQVQECATLDLAAPLAWPSRGLGPDVIDLLGVAPVMVLADR